MQAEADGDVSGSQVGDGHGDEEGGDLVKAAALAGLTAALNGADPADAAGDRHPHAAGVLPLQIQAALGHGLHCGSDGELSEAVHPAGLFFIQDPGGVEVLHLCGQGYLLAAVVVQGDGGDAARAGPDRVPGLLDGVAQGSDGPHAGDHYASFFHSSVSFLRLKPPCRRRHTAPGR